MYDTSFRRLAFGVAGAMFVISFAVSAQPPQAPATNTTPAQPAGQAAPAGGGPGGGAPPPRPILPASASSIAAKPDSFYGQVVSIYATVEQPLAPTAFSVDQDKTKSTGQELIVLATAPARARAAEHLRHGHRRGRARRRRRDREEGAGRARPRCLPTCSRSIQGKPVILATAVINGAFTDLAKFIPPPMTPEEAVLDKAMKAVGPANGALRKGIDAANAELVKTNTAILAKAFADTETFWKGRGNDEAVKFAQTARAAVAAIDSAAGHGQLERSQDAEHDARPAVPGLPRLP